MTQCKTANVVTVIRLFMAKLWDGQGVVGGADRPESAEGKCLNKNYYYINFSFTVVDTVAQQTCLVTGITRDILRWTTRLLHWPSFARPSFTRQNHILSVINKYKCYNFTYWKQWLSLFRWIHTITRVTVRCILSGALRRELNNVTQSLYCLYCSILKLFYKLIYD